MNSKLLKLRLVVYKIATDFHQLMAQYFSALQTRDEIAILAREIFETGTGYTVALDELLQHLRTLPPTPETEAEIERTRRTLDLLDIEMGLLHG